MGNDRRSTAERSNGKDASDRRSSRDKGGPSTVAEAWAAGRLQQTEKLLQRFAREFAKHEPQDPNLLRDYYRWTGNPHYRTDYEWNSGRPEETGEHPADVIERVNC